MKNKNKHYLLENENNPTDKKVLNKAEIALFKYLNKYKDKTKTKAGLINLIYELLTSFGLDNSLKTFYYETYTANFRPDGDYENLTPQNFKDYRQFKQRKTPNNTAYEYSSSKIPFKGSNLEGEWNVNPKNQWYYVVNSYGWYPIFLFINDQWYRIIDSYSSSTAKHLRGANPTHWNSQLKANVVGVTKGEMDRLIDGHYDLSLVKSNRVTNFVSDMKSKLINNKKLISSGWGENAVRVSYYITDIDNVRGKIKIVVRINKAGRMEGRKMVPNPEYQQDERLVNDIETAIKQDILNSHPKYLSDDNVDIEIIH
jgi:hypothetical protein